MRSRLSWCPVWLERIRRRVLPPLPRRLRAAGVPGRPTPQPVSVWYRPQVRLRLPTAHNSPNAPGCRNGSAASLNALTASRPHRLWTADAPPSNLIGDADTIRASSRRSISKGRTNVDAPGLAAAGLLAAGSLIVTRRGARPLWQPGAERSPRPRNYPFSERTWTGLNLTIVPMLIATWSMAIVGL